MVTGISRRLVSLVACAGLGALAACSPTTGPVLSFRDDGPDAGEDVAEQQRCAIDFGQAREEFDPEPIPDLCAGLTVVDAVAAGADSSGATPIDDVLRAEATDGVALTFPAGTRSASAT